MVGINLADHHHALRRKWLCCLPATALKNLLACNAVGPPISWRLSASCRLEQFSVIAIFRQLGMRVACFEAPVLNRPHRPFNAPEATGTWGYSRTRRQRLAYLLRAYPKR